MLWNQKAIPKQLLNNSKQLSKNKYFNSFEPKNIQNDSPRGPEFDLKFEIKDVRDRVEFFSLFAHILCSHKIISWNRWVGEFYRYSNFENFVRHLPPNSPTLEQSFITIKELRCIFLIPVLFLFRTTNSAQSEINKNSRTKKVTVFSLSLSLHKQWNRRSKWVLDQQCSGQRSSLD